MVTLLDASVLIALTNVNHVHHDAARGYFLGLGGKFATCPITEGALLRFLIRDGQTAAQAVQALTVLRSHGRHVFWPDGISFVDAPLERVVGHRQVTDAYLAGLARSRRGRLATLDEGLAVVHGDVCSLVPRERP